MHSTGDIKLKTSFSFKNKKIDKASVIKLK